MQKIYYWQRGLLMIASLVAILALPSMAFATVTDVIDPSPSATINQSAIVLPACDNQNGVVELFSASLTESTMSFTRYNDDFQKTGEFSVELPTYSYEEVEQVQIPVLESEAEWYEMKGYTLEKAEAEFSDTTYYTREVHDGQIWWILRWYDNYGKRFPMEYYMWDGAKLYKYTVWYYETGTYTGEWVNARTTTQTNQAEICSTTYLDDNGYDKYGPVLSKHFFNADDNYEYLVEEIAYQEKVIQYSDDFRRIWKGYMPSGFSIKNDKGETLGRVSVTGIESIFLADLGDKHYIGVYVSEKSGDNYIYETKWYKVNTTANATALVPVANIPISVSPRMARRSQPVTVTVPAQAGTQRIVTVVSTTGRVLLTRTLSPETDSLNIDTTDFAKGVYIVNVTCGTSVTENCKIVIQ